MTRTVALYKNTIIRLFICFCFSHTVLGQNLILDPGAESDPRWNGWTVKSCNWQMSAQVTPHGGAEHFYAGDLTASEEVAGDSCELYQDINVSSNSTNINAGTAVYTFSGWMRIFSFHNDIGVIIVEYRNASGQVLSSYNTGHNTTTTWTQYTNVTTAPVGTTDIRIRLVSLYLSGSSSDGYMDDLSLTVNTPTPVKLLYFNAIPVNDSVAVSWSTASEQNNAYFIVEKSSDGKNWTPLKNIPGNGNSDIVINYITYDPNPFEGISYYRLLQVDMDGKASLSNIIPVIFNEFIYQLYPNPVSTELHLKLASAEPYTATVVTMLGEIIPLQSKTGSDGETIFDTSQLSSGLYTIVLQTHTQRIAAKFVVQ